MGNKDSKLLRASKAGDVDRVRALLAEGANIHARHTKAWKNVLRLAVDGGHLEVVKCLLDNDKAEHLLIGHDARDAMEFAVKNNLEEIVAVFLARGYEPDHDSPGAYQALHLAAQQGLPSIAALLIDAGASLEARNGSDTTPMHEAAGKGHSEVVALLAEAGADVNAFDGYHQSPLMWAAAAGHLSTVVLLAVELGASFLFGVSPKASYTYSPQDIKDTKGYTALHLAARAGHADVIRALLEVGAGFTIETRGVASPLDIARDNGHQDCLPVLAAYHNGADEFAGGRDAAKRLQAIAEAEEAARKVEAEARRAAWANLGKGPPPPPGPPRATAAVAEVAKGDEPGAAGKGDEPRLPDSALAVGSPVKEDEPGDDGSEGAPLPGPPLSSLPDLTLDLPPNYAAAVDITP